MLGLETIKVHIDVDPLWRSKRERGGAGGLAERCLHPRHVVQRCGLREYG